MAYTPSAAWLKAYATGGPTPPLIVARIGIGSNFGGDASYKWYDVANRPYPAFSFAGATNTKSGQGSIFGAATMGIAPVLREMEQIGQKLDSWSMVQTVGEMELTLSDVSHFESLLSTPTLTQFDQAVFGKPLEIYIAHESITTEIDWLPVWYGQITDAIADEAGGVMIKASTLTTVLDECTYGATWGRTHPVSVVKDILDYAMLAEWRLKRFGFAVEATTFSLDNATWAGITTWCTTNMWGGWDNIGENHLLGEGMEQYHGAHPPFAGNTSPSQGKFMDGYPSGTGSTFSDYKVVNSRKLINKLLMPMFASLVFGRDRKIRLRRQDLTAAAAVHFTTGMYQDFETEKVYDDTLVNQIVCNMNPGQGTKCRITRGSNDSKIKYGKHSKNISTIPIGWGYQAKYVNHNDTYPSGHAQAGERIRQQNWVDKDQLPVSTQKPSGYTYTSCIQHGSVPGWTGTNPAHVLKDGPGTPANEVGVAMTATGTFYEYNDAEIWTATTDGSTVQGRHFWFFPKRLRNGQISVYMVGDDDDEDANWWVYDWEVLPARYRLKMGTCPAYGSAYREERKYGTSFDTDEGEQTKDDRIPPYGWDVTQCLYYVDKQLDRFKRGAPVIKFNVPIQYSWLELGDIVTIDNSDAWVWEGIKCNSNLKWEIVGIDLDLLKDQPTLKLTCRYASTTGFPAWTVGTLFGDGGVLSNFISGTGGASAGNAQGAEAVQRHGQSSAARIDVSAAVNKGLFANYLAAKTSSNETETATPIVSISPGSAFDSGAGIGFDVYDERIYRGVDADGEPTTEMLDPQKQLLIAFHKNMDGILASSTYRVYLPIDGAGFFVHQIETADIAGDDAAFAIDPTMGAPICEFQTNASKEPTNTVKDLRKYTTIPESVLNTRLTNGNFNGDFEQWPNGPDNPPGGWEWTGKAGVPSFDSFCYATTAQSYTGGNALRFNVKDGSYLDTRPFRVLPGSDRNLISRHYLPSGNNSTGVSTTKMRMRAYDADMGYLATSVVTLSGSGTNQWHEVKTKVGLPAGAFYVSVGIYRSGVDSTWDNVGSGSTAIYLDAITFESEVAGGTGAEELSDLSDVSSVTTTTEGNILVVPNDQSAPSTVSTRLLLAEDASNDPTPYESAIPAGQAILVTAGGGGTFSGKGGQIAVTDGSSGFTFLDGSTNASPAVYSKSDFAWYYKDGSDWSRIETNAINPGGWPGAKYAPQLPVQNRLSAAPVGGSLILGQAYLVGNSPPTSGSGSAWNGKAQNVAIYNGGGSPDTTAASWDYLTANTVSGAYNGIRHVGTGWTYTYQEDTAPIPQWQNDTTAGLCGYLDEAGGTYFQASNPRPNAENAHNLKFLYWPEYATAEKTPAGAATTNPPCWQILATAAGGASELVWNKNANDAKAFGGAYMKWNTVGSLGLNMYSEFIPVEALTEYVFSWWQMSSSGLNTNLANCKLFTYGGSGTQLTSAVWLSSEKTGSGLWSRQTYKFTTSNAAVWVRVQVYSTFAGRTIYFAGLNLKPALRDTLLDSLEDVQQVDTDREGTILIVPNNESTPSHYESRVLVARAATRDGSAYAGGANKQCFLVQSNGAGGDPFASQGGKVATLDSGESSGFTFANGDTVANSMVYSEAEQCFYFRSGSNWLPVDGAMYQAFHNYTFRAYLQANTTCGSSSTTELNWTLLHNTAATVDPNGTASFSTWINNKTWVAPRSGYYRIKAHLHNTALSAAQAGSGGTSQIEMKLQKAASGGGSTTIQSLSGPTVYGTPSTTYAGTNQSYFDIDTIIRVNMKEEIEIHIENDSSTNLITYGAAGVAGQVSSEFSITAISILSGGA